MGALKKSNCVGMELSTLETPVLMVDVDAMERNLAKMASFFSSVEANLRPHTKTHKTPALAHKQLQAGAKGICCGNLDEAEVMISAGIRDVLVTREIVSPEKITRVVGLAKHSDIMIVVDDEEVVDRFSQAAKAEGVQVRTLVDVNLLIGRCGVPPGEPTRLLSRKVDDSEGLSYMGLNGYEGSMHGIDASERKRRCKLALKALMETKALIERDGIEVQIVSAGATSTHRVSGTYPGVTEVQAGSYLTMDLEYRSFFPDFECALSVLTTVINRPSRTRVTTHAGKKKLTEDAGLPQPKSLEGVRLVALNEEHGILEITDPSAVIHLGSKLEIIPSHGCTTFNLYDHLYGMRNGKVEIIWDIAARGT